MSYLEKLRDPRWQRVRLEIMSRDNFSCRSCAADNRTLNVHHRWYETGKDPWEYPPEALVTLCEDCHLLETKGREHAEKVLLGICQKMLLVRELTMLAVAINDIRGSSKEFIEAIFYLPDHKLKEALAVHQSRMDAGPAPWIEASPQDREDWDIRKKRIIAAIERVESERVMEVRRELQNL